MPARRGLLRSAAVGAGVVAAFAVGVAVGVGGRQQPAVPTDPVAEAAQAIAADAERPVTRSDLDRAAITAMLAELGDPHAAYRAPGESDAATDVVAGSYAGLGLWLRAESDGRVVVGNVLPTSGAAQGGVDSGDELLAVDNRPARGRPVAEIVAALRGPAHSSVRVVTRGPTGTLEDRQLVRGEVETQDLGIERLAGGVLRVRVAAFSRGSGVAFRHLLADARAEAPVRGIVLDLRGNPGGLLDEAVTVASTFLDGGAVVSYERRGEAPRVLQAEPRGDTTTPLAVLVDGGTASAAEVVAGAVQDRRRALVVGARSYGKGSVQEAITLADGSTLELTVARYRTPAGRALDGVGVAPDIAVAGSTGGDPALDRAATVVGGLLADARTGTGTR